MDVRSCFNDSLVPWWLAALAVRACGARASPAEVDAVLAETFEAALKLLLIDEERGLHAQEGQEGEEG